MEQQKLPPGFRFSPTDEELMVYYLKNRACGKDYHQGMIAEVDIYKHEPWDLPEKSALPSPDPVWYFFNAQDKRHSHSARINRTTKKGYWKATGKDRKICSGPHIVGIKKTLIYYEGRAPSGKRTDWVMHEFKLDEDYEKRNKAVYSSALCRIRKKGGPGPRNGEQFGAPVYNENNEWGEDEDDAVDEKVPLASPQQGSHSASSVFMAPKEEVLLDTHTGGLAMNDFLHAESIDMSPELDFNSFLESFFVDIPEVTSIEADTVSSTAMGRTQVGCNIGCDVYAPSDLESLIGFEGANVHGILNPTCHEEQILGELLHLTENSPQAPFFADGIVYPEVVDSNDIFGDYIEMNDLDSPLDGFVLRSPSYYGNEQQQLPPDLFDEVESFALSSDLLNTQGMVSRRARLKINPPASATQTHEPQSGPTDKLDSTVPISSGLSIQIDSPFSNDSGTLVNTHSDSDSSDSIRSSLSENYLGKGSLALKTTNFINKLKAEPVISNPVSFSPSLLSTISCIKEVGFDCEAGPSSAVVPGKSSKLALASSEDGNEDVDQLVCKVKGLALGSRLVDLESNFSTTFNDKVFAQGKPITRLFPSQNCSNPYRTLRSGAMSSLCHLGLAVLVLLFIFLGIHMLSKYVLLLAA